MNIYVGNLSFEESESSLEAAFSAHGEVTSARIITDRETGRSRGFGFVEMADQTQAQAAIAGLNGTSQNGRELTVNEAKPQERSGGGYGGGGGRNGGGGGFEREKREARG